MRKYVLILAAAVSTALALALGAGAKGGFDLKNLAGSWEGEGMFLMPVTDIEVELEGEGEFVYDARRDLIRTAMKGSKFLISYADSGLLKHDLKTDSVTWEIWDNWGKHAYYRGEIRDGRLVADRAFKNKGYQVTVDFPHPDTMDFRLTLADPETLVRTTRARFLLWRVK